MWLQIAAQILADKKHLNATSAEGKIGGRATTCCPEERDDLKKEKNVVKIEFDPIPAIITFV